MTMIANYLPELPALVLTHGKAQVYLRCACALPFWSIVDSQLFLLSLTLSLYCNYLLHSISSMVCSLKSYPEQHFSVCSTHSIVLL